MNKSKKIGIIIAAVTAIATVSVFGFVYSKLNQITYDNNDNIEINSSFDENTNTQEIDITNLPQKDGDIVFSESDIVIDKNVFNILLLGTDERTKEFSVNARADSMMLLSLNLKEGTAKLVSLERGIGVPIEGRNIDLLTHTFRYGGAELTLKTVQECFKVDVNRYVRVNFNVFEQIINAIGGVDIYLTDAECEGLNYPDNQIKHPVVPGINHLDGYDALQYARLRKTDDDWHRIVRQRTVIQAVVNQTKNLNLLEINKVADVVLPMVMTNLSKTEIAKLMFHAPKFLGVQIEQMTLPQEDNCWGAVGVDGRKYIGTDFERNAEVLREFLYPQLSAETN